MKGAPWTRGPLPCSDRFALSRRCYRKVRRRQKRIVSHAALAARDGPTSTTRPLRDAKGCPAPDGRFQQPLLPHGDCGRPWKRRSTRAAAGAPRGSHLVGGLRPGAGGVQHQNALGPPVRKGPLHAALRLLATDGQPPPCSGRSRASPPRGPSHRSPRRQARYSRHAGKGRPDRRRLSRHRLAGPRPRGRLTAGAGLRHRFLRNNRSPTTVKNRRGPPCRRRGQPEARRVPRHRRKDACPLSPEGFASPTSYPPCTGNGKQAGGVAAA